MIFGEYVGKIGGDGGGGGTERFSCSSANCQTGVDMDNVCSERLGGFIRITKTVSYSGGEGSNIVVVYRSQFGGIVKYLMVFGRFHLS